MGTPRSIVFCRYDDITHEARSQEELACLERLGEVTFVSYARPLNAASSTKCEIIAKRSYPAFLVASMKAIREVAPDVVFLHDNYCAPLIPFSRKKCPDSKIAYDMSELYIGRRGPGLAGMKSGMLMRCELRHLRDADVVLAANSERALIARGYYGLRDTPIVFDNVHRIDDPCDMDAAARFKGEIGEGDFVIVYAGGLPSARSRGVLPLLRAVAETPGCTLLIAGKGHPDDPLLKQLPSNGGRVAHVGMLDRGALRALYSLADLNAVMFGMSSVNDIFCASGKQWEGLFEGVPLLAGPNPPLQRICRDEGIGVYAERSDVEEYKRCIAEAIKRKAELRGEARRCAESVRYESRLDRLTRELEVRLDACAERGAGR